jgi:hypothetical protein
MGLKGVGITVFAAIILITSSLSVPPIAAQSQEDGPHCYGIPPSNYDAAWCIYERQVMNYPNCVRIWNEYNKMLKGYSMDMSALVQDVAKRCQLPPPPDHPPPAESCESTRQALDQYLGISAAKDPSVTKYLEDTLNSESCGPPESQPLDCKRLGTCPPTEPEACEESDGNVGVSYFSNNNGKISYISTTSKPTSPEKGPRITKICDPVNGDCPEGYVFKSSGDLTWCEQKPTCPHGWKYSAAYDTCIPGRENPNEHYSMQKGRCAKWAPTPKPSTSSKNPMCNTVRDYLSYPNEGTLKMRFKGQVGTGVVSGEGEVEYTAKMTRDDWRNWYQTNCIR